MVGWTKRISRFNLNERFTGPGRARLYTWVSKQRTAAAWRTWATSAIRGAAFRAGAAGLAAGAAYYGYKYFRNKKRRMTEPYTVARKRSRVESGGGSTSYRQDAGANYLQLTHAKGYGGKKLSKTEKKLKLLGAHMNAQIERFQACSIAATNGYYPLNHVTVNTNQLDLPVYLLDITSMVNFGTAAAGGAQAAYVPSPLMRLRADDSGGYSWVIQQGTVTPSGTRSIWQIERSGRNQTLSSGHNFISMGDKAMIEWIDFRMLLYGARSRPSSVTFQIVQFTDVDYVPYVSGQAAPGGADTILDTDNSVAATDTPEYGKWQTFWDQVVSKLIGNPIGKRGMREYELNANARVLCSKTFDFQPIDSGEADTTGHQVDYHYFHRMNKVIDYTSDPQANALADDDAKINQNVYPVYLNNKLAPFCNKKGRVFAMWTGVNIQDSTGEGTQGNFGPSFDLICRRKTSIIRN